MGPHLIFTVFHLKSTLSLDYLYLKMTFIFLFWQSMLNAKLVNYHNPVSTSGTLIHAAKGNTPCLLFAPDIYYMFSQCQWTLDAHGWKENHCDKCSVRPDQPSYPTCVHPHELAPALADTLCTFPLTAYKLRGGSMVMTWAFKGLSMNGPLW